MGRATWKEATLQKEKEQVWDSSNAQAIPSDINKDMMTDDPAQRKGHCQVGSCYMCNFAKRQNFTTEFPSRLVYLLPSYLKKYPTSHISQKSDKKQENLPP